MSYIGQRPVVGRYIKLDQISSGFNGSNTGFSMTAGSQAVFPGTARNLLLSLGGVIQEPDTDFTISGSTLTFTTAPVANTTFFGVIYGDMQATGTPSDGTVLPASIASSGNFSFPEVTVTGDLNAAGDIVHIGDTNTKIRFSDTDQIKLETGGAQRLKLDGTEAVFNDDGVSVDFRVEGDTDANLFFVDASTDHIGIGKSSDIHEKLNILDASQAANSRSGGLLLQCSATSGADVGVPIAWRGQVGNGTEAQTYGLASICGRKENATYSFDAASAKGYLQFCTTDNAGAEKMRISSDGKVGIGTTSPSRKLHLVGSNPMVLIEGSGGNGRQYALASSDDTTGAAVDGGNPGSFAIYDDTANAARLVINSSGNVGIGTTNPSAALEVVGGTGVNVLLNATTHDASTANQARLQLGFVHSGGQALGHLKLDEGGGNSFDGILKLGVPYNNGSGGSSTREVIEADFNGNICFPGSTTVFDTTARTNGLQLYYETDSGIATIASYSSGGNTRLDLGTNSGGGAVGIGMTIRETGNVGIGTSSPSTKLQVANGHINLSAGYSLQWDDSHERIEQSNSKIEFFTNNGEQMTLSGSNLGLGVVSPDTLLHLAGGSPNIKLDNTGTSASTNDVLGAILFQHADADDPGITAKIQCVAEDNAGNSFLAFYNGDGGNADERVRISADGQFRAGDESSSDRTSYRHQLSTAANSSACLSLQNPTNSDGQGIKLGFWARNTNNAALEFARIVAMADETQANSTQKGSLTFENNVSASMGERMRIHNNGYVGIGTTNPGKMLTVDTSVSDSNHFIAEFTGTDSPGNKASSCNFYYMLCGSDDNRTGLYWEHQMVANNRMWMDDSSNLRQSSSDPTANNSGTAFSYAGGSDYRLKENVVNYTNGITELKQLKPYKFNYIETDRIIVDKPDVLVSGFYAHEAGAVVPNSLIGTKDEVDAEGGPIYQSLKYEKFVPLLTAALQEAIAKIETLEAKVAALEAA